MTEFLTFLTEYNPIMDLIIIVLLGITLGFDIVPFVKNYLCGLFGAKKENGCSCGCDCCKETKETKEGDKKQEFPNESLAQTPELIKNMTKSTKPAKTKETKPKTTKIAKETKEAKVTKTKATKTKTEK